MPEHFGLSNSLLPYIEAIFCGLLEVTNGISMVASLGTSVFTICLASLLLRIWWNIYSNASCKYNLRQRIINKTIFSRKNIACIFFSSIYITFTLYIDFGCLLLDQNSALQIRKTPL